MDSVFSRRAALRGMAAGAAWLLTPSLRAFADNLTATARTTEGPFYPNELPLDTDNDLLILNGKTTPAVGQITHLTGRVLTKAGSAVRNAVVEIWQVDNNGAYINTNDPRHKLLDTNFQGYGRFLTDSKGRYYFRTIKPVSYPGRVPHIHVSVNCNGKRLLTTQLLVKGNPRNARDGVFRSIRDKAARESLLVDFKPIPKDRLGAMAAHFDMILGVTPEEPDTVKGGIAPSQWGRRNNPSAPTPRRSSRSEGERKRRRLF